MRARGAQSAAHRRRELEAHFKHRPSRGRAECGVLVRQHRHPVGHQHPRHGGDRGVERGVQCGNSRLRRAQLVFAGLHDLCRPELRRRADQALQEDDAAQLFGGGHRDICLGRCPAAERKVAARHFQQRSRGHCHRLYSPCDDPAGVCFLPDLRNTLRVSARLRHFARARTFDDARRVRYPHRVGQVRLPDEHDVPDRHVGLSHQPLRNGDPDLRRGADLSPVQALCKP